MEAPVFVREDLAKLGEVYPKMAGATPSGWSCASTTGHLRPPARDRGVPAPVVHEFLPDVERFYRGWPGREVP